MEVSKENLILGLLKGLKQYPVAFFPYSELFLAFSTGNASFEKEEQQQHNAAKTAKKKKRSWDSDRRRVVCFSSPPPNFGFSSILQGPVVRKPINVNHG